MGGKGSGRRKGSIRTDEKKGKRIMATASKKVYSASRAKRAKKFQGEASFLATSYLGASKINKQTKRYVSLQRAKRLSSPRAYKKKR